MGWTAIVGDGPEGPKYDFEPNSTSIAPKIRPFTTRLDEGPPIGFFVNQKLRDLRVDGEMPLDGQTRLYPSTLYRKAMIM